MHELLIVQGVYFFESFILFALEETSVSEAVDKNYKYHY